MWPSGRLSRSFAANVGVSIPCAPVRLSASARSPPRLGCSVGTVHRHLHAGGNGPSGQRWATFATPPVCGGWVGFGDRPGYFVDRVLGSGEGRRPATVAVGADHPDHVQVGPGHLQPWPHHGLPVVLGDRVDQDVLGVTPGDVELGKQQPPAACRHGGDDPPPQQALADALVADQRADHATRQPTPGQPAPRLPARLTSNRHRSVTGTQG